MDERTKNKRIQKEIQRIKYMNDQQETPLWWRVFTIEFLRNGENATQAYLKAKPGVSYDSAATESSKLLGNPMFLKLLQDEKEKVSQRLDMDLNEWLDEISAIAKQPIEKVDATSKLRALEMLGKAKKFFPENEKTRIDVKSAVNVDVVSILKRLRESQVPGMVIDIAKEVEELKAMRDSLED